MPRGGKRTGAGAPKGNFNAVRTGQHSDRMAKVYAVLVEYPDHKALAHELYHAGFLTPPHFRFNRDIRGIVDYLYGRWFDCLPGAQSNRNQLHRSAPPPRRRRHPARRYKRPERIRPAPLRNRKSERFKCNQTSGPNRKTIDDPAPSPPGGEGWPKAGVRCR